MNLIKVIGWPILTLLILPLWSCSTHINQRQISSKEALQPASLVLATPLQVSYQNELALARLGQILNELELTAEQRAEIHYQRGVVFNRVGLHALARLDFTQALREKPDFAEAYNFIGIYLLQQQNYDEAYEAFDSALELNPNQQYTLLNRGIALYYGNRPELAKKDLTSFFKSQPKDPYSILWLYFVEQKIDPTNALEQLNLRLYRYSDNTWNWDIIRLYMNDIDSATLMNNVTRGVKNNRELAERLCETYFYVGKFELLKGNRKEAISYFKLAIANNVYDFMEHRYAILELDLIPRKSISHKLKKRETLTTKEIW